MNDTKLLERFARDGSAEAFRELVARHTNFVYSCAVQRLHDAHAAQDVTQAVFLALALKAKGLSPDAPLPGWLFKATRYACAKHQRGEQRRKEREMHASEQLPDPTSTSVPWAEIEPYLASAMDKLPDKDREAVFARFYRQGSYRDVAAVLQTTEDSARKRVDRALEKLRAIFTKKGVVLSAAGLAGLLTDNAVQAAPAGLATTCSGLAAGSALASISTSTSTSTLMLAKGALHAMFIHKVKTVSLAAAACLVVAGAGIVVAQQLAAPPPLKPAVTTSATTPYSTASPALPKPDATVGATQPQSQAAAAVSKVIRISPYVNGGLREVIFRCTATREERRAKPSESCMQCHTLAANSWPEIADEGKPQDLSALRRTKWGKPNGTSGGEKAPLTVKVGQEFEIELPVASHQEGARWAPGPAPAEIFEEIKKYDRESKLKRGESVAEFSGDTSPVAIIGQSVVAVAKDAEFLPARGAPEGSTTGKTLVRYRAVKAGTSEIRVQSFRQIGSETQYCAEYLLKVDVEEQVAPGDVPAINEGAAQHLALSWVNGLLAGRVDTVLSLSDVPFGYDKVAKVKTVEELKSKLEAVVQDKGARNLVAGEPGLLKGEKAARAAERFRMLVTDDLTFVTVVVEAEGKKGGITVAIKPGNELKVVGFAD